MRTTTAVAITSHHAHVHAWVLRSLWLTTGASLGVALARFLEMTGI
jgi:hypothetical protein